MGQFNQTILVVAAHPDDEILGCGGTMAKLAALGCKVHVVFLADGETSRTGLTSAEHAVLIDARRQQAAHAMLEIGCSSWTFHDYPDNCLDTVPLLELAKTVEKQVKELRPKKVFTHFPGDLNIDHQIVSRAVLTACRPIKGHSVGEILYFEVPSSTEWNPGADFTPNCYVNIEGYLDIKIKAMRLYQDELRDFPHPRSDEAIRALASYRGASSGLLAAEGFVIARKIYQE